MLRVRVAKARRRTKLSQRLQRHDPQLLIRTLRYCYYCPNDRAGNGTNGFEVGARKGEEESNEAQSLLFLKRGVVVPRE
jgi:hypothetical protein